MSQFPSAYLQPGVSDPLLTVEAALTWGRFELLVLSQGCLASTAVDAGNTPTTMLRPGLLLLGAERRALLDHELHHLELKRDKKDRIRKDDLGRPLLRMRKHDRHGPLAELLAAGLAREPSKRLGIAAMRARLLDLAKGSLLAATGPLRP